MNSLMLVDVDTRDTLRAGGIQCDWIFRRESIELMRSFDNAKFVDMLLDFGSVFPKASALLLDTSARLRKLVGREFRLCAVTATSDGRVEERVLCLDEGSSVRLVNDL